MNRFERRLRTPEERVGMLSNASLPPPRAPEPADDALLARALGGDHDAFAHALDLYFPAMLRLARTHVRSRAAAEDVIQDTWLAALSGFATFERRSSVKTWLFRILRNIARTRGRRDARTVPFSELAGDGSDSTHDAPADRIGDAMWMRGSDPEGEYRSRELGARIEAAIATLPPRQREVLVLRDVEGWPSAEVCNVLALSDTHQRVLLHRARERVRQELRRYPEIDELCSDA